MPGRRPNTEGEYFVREEALKKQKLALEQARAMAAHQKEELKKLHFNHCPKCGMELHTLTFHGIEVDRCFACGGTWLEDGDLEKLAVHDNEQAGAVVRSVLNIFTEIKRR